MEETQKEVGHIINLAFKNKEKVGSVDLEVLEMRIRSSVHGIGRVLLEELINADKGDYRGRVIPCEKGHEYEFVEYREKSLLTVLGEIKVNRAYYYDNGCNHGMCPKDKSLDIVGSSFSPGVRRMMGRVGAYSPFGVGHDDIKELAGIEVTAKGIERVSHQLGEEAEGFQKKEVNEGLPDKVIPIKSVPIMYVCMDGTGVPVVKSETVGRHGKGEDGIAKTREVKLGCIFTQTTVDEKGYAVRDEGSTSYVGAIERADEFNKRIYGEAMRRGLPRAEKICVIGDGAPWIWNIAGEEFSGAIQIIDLYHAREHYWNVARIFWGHDKEKMNQWAKKRHDELDSGKAEEVIKAIRRLLPSTDYEKDVCEREINYFEKNKERMHYAEYRRQGLFVGSGVLEAGCRTVVGQRLKQSGMHWTLKGANSIIALRCCFLSNRWEDFWKYRACA